MKHYHKNPRRITAKQFDQLRDTLAELGDLSGIVHDLNSDEIIGGNMRSDVFNVNHCEIELTHQADAPDEQGTVALGFIVWKGKRYAYRQVRWTPKQCEKANIVANKAGGTWDFDELANSFDMDDLLTWGFEPEELGLDFSEDETASADAEPQTDKAEELRQKWGVEPGQLWRIGNHRLICGDCTDPATVARLMGGEKADCVFTSPPYAVGVDYGETYQDTIDNLRGMLPKLSALWLDVVTDGGFAVLNFGDIASGRNITKTAEPCEYPMALEYWPVFRADGWLLWSRRIWCKPNPRVHSLHCIGSNRAATDWEHLWTWRKSGKPIMERVDGELRSPLGWYQSSLMTGVEVGKDDHGAGMATGIAEWMINIHARQCNVVHEPFCGTGTTLVACQNLDRWCRAIEISAPYVAVILQRMTDAFPDIEIERL